MLKKIVYFYPIVKLRRKRKYKSKSMQKYTFKEREIIIEEKK